MENRDWLNEYMLLKQVTPGNPFTVPSGYFDEAEQSLLLYAKLEGLKTTNGSNGFTVPENYFNELTDNIQSRVNIEAALNTENKGFTIPADYFENFEQQVKSRIAVEEILNKGQEAFSVPENYFETLNANILNKLAAEQQPKREAVVRRLLTSGMFKYATAACIVLMVGTGIFLSQSTDPVTAHNNSYLHKELSNVPIDDIKSYLQTNVDGSDTQHTVAVEGTNVDANSLNNALQNNLEN